MKIKQLPEDFIVKEISSVKPLGQGEHVWCTLKKTDWDLLKLVKLIAEKLQISRSRIGYAGTKDKVAVTYQTISFFNISPEKIRNLNIKGAEFSDFEYNQRAIKLGELKGNWFSITVRDLEAKYNKEFLDRKVKEIEKRGVVNLFDSQRFGTRNITHLVGKEIMKGNIPEAVFLYLTKTNKDEKEEVRKARVFLEKTEDFSEAINLFPKYQKWDIAILNHLIQYPEDYAGAIKILPKTLQLMFIHAYQSYLWNLTVLEYDKKHPGENIKIPMVGFNTKLGNSEVDKSIKRILNKEKMGLEDFKIKEIPYLSSSGSTRNILVFPENPKYKIEKDELNKGKNKAIIEFELPKGSYGTHVVKEIFD